MPMRNTEVITPPDASDPLISLTLMQDHVRDHRASSVPTLQLYQSAAEAQLDGKDGVLGMSLKTQTLEHTYTSSDGCYIGRVLVPYGPIQSIDSVALDGVALAATDFEVCKDLGVTYVNVTNSGAGKLVVTATHGYGDAEDVPDNIRLAAALLASEMFKHRATTISGPAELIQLVPLFDQIVCATSRVGQTFEGWNR